MELSRLAVSALLLVTVAARRLPPTHGIRISWHFSRATHFPVAGYILDPLSLGVGG